MWSTFHAKMDRCQFLPLPLQRLFVTREKAPVREGKERMVNLLFQETSNLSLQANVTSQNACFEKDWRLWAIFSFCIPPPSLPFLRSSSSVLHLHPPLCWEGLLSLLKHPCAHRYYQGFMVHLKSFVCVEVSLNESKRDGMIYPDRQVL